MSSLVHAFRSLSVLEIPWMSQVMAMLHLGSMFPPEGYSKEMLKLDIQQLIVKVMLP